MTFKELTEQYAKRNDIPVSTAAKLIKSFEELLVDVVSNGDSICLPQVGTLYKRDYPSRRFFNPKVGDYIQTVTKNKVAFKATKYFMKKVNE